MGRQDPKSVDLFATAPVPSTIRLARMVQWIAWPRVLSLLAGLALFGLVYFVLSFPDALGPGGERVPLTREARGALALFALAATWWVLEVIPLGVTSLALGVLQVLFFLRPATEVFGHFMDLSIWFIFGAITTGMAFSRSGLTNRLAFGMLVLVGERTRLIYLGSFAITAGLTLILAHTAVAATVYPLLMSIYALYADDDKPTRFGKGLFIGMAMVASAGSIMTLLGSARAAVAIGFFQAMGGHPVSFFELSFFLLPLGALMVLLIWLLCLVWFPPEKPTIPGLSVRARMLYRKLGPMTPGEVLALAIVLTAIAVMILQAFVPELASLDKSAVILGAAILFFVFRILTIKELENIPWNILLLFGGATSLGFCLWQTGAARWLALQVLTLFPEMHWFFFLLVVALAIVAMTNFLLNVATIALALPVALALAPHWGVAPDVVFYSCLVTAGMPFLLLIGSAPNAIAYESKQFSAWTFFLAGLPPSMFLLVLLMVFVLFVWPIMGMPILGR